MVALRLTALLLAFGLVTFPLVGCGGDDEGEADGAETSSADEVSENTDGGDAAAGSMASLQKDLYEVILSIETVEDAEAADPKVEEIFTKMGDLIREYGDDPQAAAAAQNDPAAREYEQKMQDHIREISMKSPKVGLAIGQLMMKHVGKVTDAASDVLGSEDMGKAMEKAGEALDDAQKALDEISGE